MVLHRLLFTLSFAFWIVIAINQQALSLETQGNSDVCAGVITDAEMRETIPLHLLRAISLVESGKWDKEKGARVAWPWTVMAEGKGRYLPTRQAAIAEVKKLKAKGVRNIDVGCMQINLRHHPEAFSSLDEAFDPYRNVEYAAQFLASLRKKSPSWTSAVGRYHSYNQKFSTPYRRKVFKAWRDEKHRLNREMRLAALEKKTQKKTTQEQQKARKPGAVSVSHIQNDRPAKALVSLPKRSPRRKSASKLKNSQQTQTPRAKTDQSPELGNNRSIATRILFATLMQNS